MTDDRLPLADLLAKAGDDEFFRSVAEAVLQMLMEAGVEGLTDQSAGLSSRQYNLAQSHSMSGPASDSMRTGITSAI